MSAVAAVVQQGGIALLSDGIIYNTQKSKMPEGTHAVKRSECSIVATDYNKVIKVNSHVGVLWVGNTMKKLQARFRQECRVLELQEPKEIAEHLSIILKWEYQNMDISETGGTYLNVNIAVMGFDKNNTPWAYDISVQNNFTPNAHKISLSGPHELESMCVAPFVDRAEIGNAFTQAITKRNRQTTNPEKLITAAFTEVIRNYEDQDKLVGGKIFCELLQPRRQSKFRQAMLN